MRPALPDTPPVAAQFLTTKEVADLLRVKERKVYDLAASGDIPHRRVTGKLLFPAVEIADWMNRGEGAAPKERPAVLSGSHDPLLDWALQEARAGLATLFNGSEGGLKSFAEGQAALCGLHLPDATGWNIAAVETLNPPASVLVNWATRRRGLILAPGLAAQVQGLAALRGRRVVLRPPGAGGASFFQRLLVQEQMTLADFDVVSGLAHTEHDAAAAVAAGQAEAAIGLEAMARQFSCDFLPLAEEKFDLLIDQRAYFTAPVQTLMWFTRGPAFAARAEALGGYDLSDTGRVRWVAPA
jgi:putative molybdopterin biosynthesis protein